MSRHDPRAHDLTPELLLRAYAAGIFPMAESGDDPGVFWVDPQVRGVIPLNDFHVPRRLKKTVRGGAFEVRFDTAFTEVLELCAKSKRGRRETWINAPIKNAVEGLFELGFAHSVETWRDGNLVGGLTFVGAMIYSTHHRTSPELERFPAGSAEPAPVPAE